MSAAMLPLSAAVSAGALRQRRYRKRQRLGRIAGMLKLRPRAMFLPRLILEAWALRGLRFAPSDGQVLLLAPLTSEPTGGVAACAIAAMSEAPPVGSTYELVRVMLAAARDALARLRKRSFGGQLVHTTDMESSTRGGAGDAKDEPGSTRAPLPRGARDFFDYIRAQPWYRDSHIRDSSARSMARDDWYVLRDMRRRR